MTDTAVGYVGIDHHHRDPYLSIAGELGVDVVAVCEPGEAFDVEALRPQQDRPDEITSEGADVASVTRGAAVYEDPISMVRSADLDVVWITYRNDENPAIVEAAVEAGVHVISEKPIARTRADLEPVAEAARERGVTVSPTTFYRTNPVAVDLRERVREGFFGDLRAIEGRFVASQLSYRDTDHYIYDRAASRGGALQWIGPHWLDLLPWIAGERYARVNARTIPATEADVDVEAGVTLQFETESGVAGTYQTGYYLSERGKDTHLGLYGADAQARTPVHHDPLAESSTVPLEITAGHDDWSATRRRRTEYEFTDDRFPAWGDYVLDYFEAFFEGYETGDVPAAVEDALHLLAALDAAYESAETGEWVAVEI